jgi:adenosylcobinamide kinase/adenosylcobinamide-phosphate guanylyltransferase
VPFRRILILGGARSGKSALAERLAAECGEPVVYVATATASDAEMAERIRQHRARRPASWRTMERRLGLCAALAEEQVQPATVVVEDLTLLLSNVMEQDVDGAEARARDEVAALVGLEASVILVSNEVGMGLVPTAALGRQFRDALGRLNQAAAAACDEVFLVVAGLPLRLK